MTSPAARILVIRNDRLGDFMLAWPAFSLLKRACPDAQVIALVPEYTKPMAELCPWIDDVIVDTRGSSTIGDARTLSRRIGQAGIDASISLYSETRTSLALCLAGTKLRFGPATKIAQLFLNRRLLQKRSHSAKPEFEYNVDLVRHFISEQRCQPAELPGPPYLQFDEHDIAAERADYFRRLGIDSGRKLVIVHPGSGGSAINLSLQQYAELVRRLSETGGLHFVITAGPGEADKATALGEMLGEVGHSIYHSNRGLVTFSRFIATCDVFISGSTGPLHIAGALDIPTVAFYPSRRSATALRWQTLNSKDKRLAYSAEGNDMRNIDLNRAALEIRELLN